jgi:hypothetical protein
MAKVDEFQRLWRDFEIEHDHAATSIMQVVDWALHKKVLALPYIDARQALATQMSRALREEQAVDDMGRRYRVNHAVRITKDGVQQTIWGILGHTDHAHMELAFEQRRSQIIGDLVQLQTDIAVYNRMPTGNPPIQLCLDFTAEVEARYAKTGEIEDFIEHYAA